MFFLVVTVTHPFVVSGGIGTTPVMTTTDSRLTNNTIVPSVPSTFNTLTPPLTFASPYIHRQIALDFMIGVIRRNSQWMII